MHPASMLGAMNHVYWGLAHNVANVRNAENVYPEGCHTCQKAGARCNTHCPRRCRYGCQCSVPQSRQHPEHPSPIRAVRRSDARVQRRHKPPFQEVRRAARLPFVAVAGADTCPPIQSHRVRSLSWVLSAGGRVCLHCGGAHRSDSSTRAARCWPRRCIVQPGAMRRPESGRRHGGSPVAGCS